MKAAGAIVLGRTNLPEFALRLSTDNPLRGSTLNPWNPLLTPGGSSGGDAAALATGMTPFGLGNDLGGSLRSPAYCCGVAALKPTLGRIPRAGSIPPLDGGMATQAMAVEGPMARSVADLRLGLAVLAGRDVRDPRSVDVPLQGPAPPVRRAAVVTQIPGTELPPETIAEIERAGRILARPDSHRFLRADAAHPGDDVETSLRPRDGLVPYESLSGQAEQRHPCHALSSHSALVWILRSVCGRDRADMDATAVAGGR